SIRKSSICASRRWPSPASSPMRSTSWPSSRPHSGSSRRRPPRARATVRLTATRRPRREGSLSADPDGAGRDTRLAGPARTATRLAPRRPGQARALAPDRTRPHTPPTLSPTRPHTPPNSPMSWAVRFAEAASLILLRSTGLLHHAADHVHSQASDSGGTVNDESTETPVRVTICAPDPITEAGLTNQVTSQDSLRLVPWSGRAGADVLVFCAGDLAAERGIPTLRRLASEVAKPVVLVVDKIEEADLMSAVACRVVAVLPRVATTGERLAHAVRTAAAGGGMLPPHMLGDLLKHLEHLQREV